VAGPLLLSAAALIFDEHGRILLIKENYGRRRWGLPGGMIEPGETPTEAVVREVREETCIGVSVGPLVGAYTLRHPDHTLLCFAFRCEHTRGTPSVPAADEIEEVAWLEPDAIPHPRTNTLPPALDDALAGRLGVAREVPKLT
jgi:8-oxo-dGTP diphosphatase